MKDEIKEIDMKNPSKHLAVLCAAGALALCGPAASQQTPTQSDKATTLHAPTVTARTETMSGKVTAVNMARRTVQIVSDAGQPMSLVVGPAVRNAHNIKVGDRVTARYTEAMAIALAEVPGTTDDMGAIRTKVEAQAAAQAQGTKPGVGVTEHTTLVANVFDVDRERGMVTLRGTSGVPFDVRVSDPQTLQQIDKNDQVLMTYVEAAAVSIEPAAAAAGAIPR